MNESAFETIDLASPDGGAIAPNEANCELGAADFLDGTDGDLSVPELADALACAPCSAVNPRRKGEWIRLGSLAVPLNAAAWTGSFFLHGSILAGAALIASVMTLRLPPAIDFARGDGSAEVGVRHDATGIEAVSLGAPSAFSTQDAGAARSVEADANENVPEPTFESSAQVSAAMAGDLPRSQEEDALIGIAPPAGAPMPRSLSSSSRAVSAFTAELGGRRLGDSSSADSATPSIAAPSVVAPVRHGGAISERGTPGVISGVDSRGVAFPVYPVESLRRKEYGTVILSVELDASGRVMSISVVNDPGYPRLVKAAIDAVRSTPFPPATENGIAVGSIVSIPFRFSLR